MYKSKKGMSMEFIIMLILSIIILLILTFYIYDSMNEGKYQASLVGCEMFFKQIEGKPAFFNNSLNQPNEKLFLSIASLCPSRSIKINDDEIQKVTGLIEDCWRKTGSGVDFYGATTQDVGVCLHCGSIEVDNEIPNFGDLVKKELNNLEDSSLFDQSVEVVNLNPDTLKQIPVAVSEKQRVEVFYYSYKPKFPSYNEDTGIFEIIGDYFDSEVLTPISEFIGNGGTLLSLANYLVSDSNVDTFAGIVLYREFDNTNKDVDEAKSVINTRGCNLIKPDKNFDY